MGGASTSATHTIFPLLPHAADEIATTWYFHFYLLLGYTWGPSCMASSRANPNYQPQTTDGTLNAISAAASTALISMPAPSLTYTKQLLNPSIHVQNRHIKAKYPSIPADQCLGDISHKCYVPAATATAAPLAAANGTHHDTPPLPSPAYTRLAYSRASRVLCKGKALGLGKSSCVINTIDRRSVGSIHTRGIPAPYLHKGRRVS